MSNPYLTKVAALHGSSSASTLSSVQKVLGEHCGVHPSQVLPSHHLRKDLGMDELDHLEATMALEEHFDREVPDEVAEKMHTVQDWVNHFSGMAKKAHWNDVAPGVFQDSEAPTRFEITEEAKKRISEQEWSPYFSSQKSLGRKTFGAIGAGLGGLIGTSPLMGTGLRQRAVNAVVGAGIGLGLGALAGHGLASAGNNQWRNDPDMVASSARKHLSRRYADWGPIQMDTRE